MRTQRGHLPPHPSQHDPTRSPHRQVETLCGLRESDWVLNSPARSWDEVTCWECKQVALGRRQT